MHNSETILLKPTELQWAKSLRAIIIGCSQSGKSTFVENILKNRQRILQSSYQKIWWCSPNFGHFGGVDHEQMRYQEQLTKLVQPIPISFHDHILDVNEFLEGAARARGALGLRPSAPTG